MGLLLHNIMNRGRLRLPQVAGISVDTEDMDLVQFNNIKVVERDFLFMVLFLLYTLNNLSNINIKKIKVKIKGIKNIRYYHFQ